jgi:protein-S-isoprenylcysteine O-methyltransferase Ste14
MTLSNLALFLSAFISFAAFSWGVKKHFRSTGAMPIGMKITSGLSLAFFAWFAVRLAFVAASSLWLAAVVLFVSSLAVFLWAISASRKTPPTLAFDTDKPSFLLRHGPYRYVRHPFYLAYMMFWTGTAIASPSLLAWFAPLVMFALYSHAASREEQKFAGSDLAAAYASYRTQAGMFLPRPSALIAG